MRLFQNAPPIKYMQLLLSNISNMPITDSKQACRHAAFDKRHGACWSLKLVGKKVLTGQLPPETTLPGPSPSPPPTYSAPSPPTPLLTSRTFLPSIPIPIALAIVRAVPFPHRARLAANAGNFCIARVGKVEGALDAKRLDVAVVVAVVLRRLA